MNKYFSPDATTYREGVEDLFKLFTLHPVEDRDKADLQGACFLTAPSTWQSMFFGRKLDYTATFQRVSLPTLVIYGQHDLILTQLAAEQFREIIPHAQLSYYPCGHAPFYECAERFNLELVQFLNASCSK